METLRLRPAYLQSDSELLLTLDEVEAARTLLETLRLQLIADLESRGLAKSLGAKDTVEFLSLRHRRDPGDIRRDLRLATNLPKYEAVTAALPDPQAPVDPETPAVLHPALATAIVETLEKAPPTVHADVLRVAEEQLIEAAKHLSPSALRDFGRQVLDRLDTDGPEPADDLYRKESLTLRPVDGGVKFNGYLAAENAELLKTQIHRLAKPHKTIDGERDPRSRDKRQADALTTILEIAAGATATPGVPGVPHLTVTIDFGDLQNAAAGAAGAAGAPGAAGAAWTTGAAGTAGAAGELVFGNNLSASAVRRLACEATVLPIVLGSKSQPLDVGTEQRFVTGAIRRALNKRDKGCVICHAPPSNCHAHHLIHWANGGSTSITNLVLVCGAHHTAVHDGHWTITITDDVVYVARPTWTSPLQADPTALIQQTLLNNDADPTDQTSRRHAVPAAPAAPAAPTASAGPAAPTASAASAASAAPAASAASAASLSWLTPAAVAHLNPWGETGTPSTGP
ncbi:HNH endonuclease signature motif containing protein [Kribbella sp. CA-293567]|uniref:HNH endonuclease signature motif containing protein n=1 Tax=Kribbella sp. CA-293567 TaxID=3002436 RepID=UPI0022DE4B7E|nr:HNH endonuclease signature motif containing protein [Kribbella sp. CA-293567]WBQ02861.1 DUF222 domain-containing protein [Kribbella sp. CA-293567]